MLVKNRMTPNPITITPHTTVPDALKLTQDQGIDYLPVVNKRGKLMGILSQTDLMQAKPSKATTLSVFEANYLLAHLQVQEIMNEPITVSEETPIEEAARIMVSNDIGCLPVKRGKKLTGIITETDIFKAFVEILGGGDPMLRITLRSPDEPGELARLTGVIAGLGGNLHSVASFKSEDAQHVYFTFRLEGVEEDTLIPALQEMEEEVIHVVCLN